MTHATDTQTQELIDELTEIQAEILDALERAEQLLRQGGFEGALMRAKSYWLAHAKCAITKNHGYLGGSLITMEDTLLELQNGEEEDEG